MKRKALIIVFVLCSVVSAMAWSASPKPLVIARGAEYSGIVSVRFSPSGEMYVSEAFRGEMMIMDPRTGKVLDSFTEGIHSCSDMAFTADGTMYWVNAFVGEIYKMAPGGVPTKIADLGTVIDGVAVNDEGRVFTASFSDVQATWEIDPDGINDPEIVLELGGFDAMDFCPDGYLYGPDFQGGSGRIFQIDVDAGEVNVVAEGFINPSSVRCSPTGELHVLDSGGEQVVKVDVSDGTKTVVADIPPMSDNFDFSPGGEIFIAFVTNAFVGKILPSGQTRHLSRPGFATPGAISVRTDDQGKEQLFVADAFSYRRFDGTSGRVLESVYPGAATLPFALADNGTLLAITNTMFNQVQVFDPETMVTYAFYPDFAVPVNAIFFGDDLVVAELGTGQLVRASDRAVLMSGLSVPAGLAVADGDLWVSDWETGMVWKPIEDGELLATPELVAYGLQNPEGMAVDLDGTLLVMETGARRLVRIDPSGCSMTVIADDLDIGLPATPGFGPSGLAMSGVAVADSGNLYFTGDVSNVVYKITR